jgi:hypothetical protein
MSPKIAARRLNWFVDRGSNIRLSGSKARDAFDDGFMKGEPSRGTSGYNARSLSMATEVVLDLKNPHVPVPEYHELP